MQKRLSEVFTVAARAAQPSSELDVALAAYVEAARAVWPEFGLDPFDFVRYVAERAADGQVPPLRHAADLWLACACVQGVPSACTCFLREHEPLMNRIMSRRGAASDMAADVRQALAERLLVGDPAAGRHAKIGDYKGQGALRHWVATAVATTLASEQRAAGRRREKSEAAADDALLGQADPELDYLKQRYAAQCHDAITQAVEALCTRDKALLRLHLKERLSIDALGSMYGVDRATAARWLAAARYNLKDQTVQRLRASLRLHAWEGESLLGLVNSQLDVSLLLHLGAAAEEPTP